MTIIRWRGAPVVCSCHILTTQAVTHLYTNSDSSGHEAVMPLKCQLVDTSIQLIHSDSLRVQYICVNLLIERVCLHPKLFMHVSENFSQDLQNVIKSIQNRHR